MSAEAIAKVIADIRAGRHRRMLAGDERGDRLQEYVDLVANAASGPVVDATEIYQPFANCPPREINYYEDHPCIAPPWLTATICYQNQHGNVVAIPTISYDIRDGDYAGGPYDTRSRTGFVLPPRDKDYIRHDLENARVHSQQGPWTPAEPVDWDDVRWVTDAFVFIGGKDGDGERMPTLGPVHHWKFAIYSDGRPADLHWVHLIPQYPMELWDMAHLVLLGSLNFMNCRNVELVDPQRPRAEARRIARTGVTVSTINVFPVGKSTRGTGGGQGLGTPVTPVAGHFAHYGPRYGRGLLFGKHEGKFWIPQHARGDQTLGETEHEYRLVPNPQEA